MHKATFDSHPAKAIEKRLHLYLHQDGLFDILAGMLVALFGLIPLLDNTGMDPWLRQVIYLGLYACGVLLILYLKRSVTRVRAGVMVLRSAQRRNYMLVLLGVNLGIFIALLSLFLLHKQGNGFLAEYQLSIVLGLIFLVMYSSAAQILRAARFYIWGLLVLTFFLGGGYLFAQGLAGMHGIPLAAFTSGGLIACWGSYLFIRFIKNNPKQA